MEKYKFDCGCQFDIIDSTIKPNDGLPSIALDFSNINYNCNKTWDLFHLGRTKGVFQLENKLGQTWASKIKPSTIDELSAVISVIRPGTLKSYLDDKNLTQHFADRKNGEEKTSYIHPLLEPILMDTYGILVYQEQAMRIAVDLAGFSLQEADTLRKCVTGDTTFVSKQRGIISISELLKTGYNNDDFLVMDEFGNQSWKKIEKIWSTGKHDVRTVKTRTGLSVKATKYHKFLTNEGWKARIRLSENDFLITARQISYDGIDEISSDLAIIIAGLITEGYFTENNSTFVNYDNKMMNLFSQAMINEFNYVKTGNNNKVFYIPKHISKSINKYMDYGLSKDKYIPNVMMRMTLESTRKFLSFMLAAEGGICKKSKSFEYTSKSKKCIHQVQLLLLRFGIRSVLIEKHNKKYGIFYTLYINQLSEQLKLFKELSEFWPDSKKTDLESILEDRTSQFTIDIIPKNIVKSLLDEYPYATIQACGSIYKNDISRIKFQKMAEKSNDKKYIKLSTGCHFYDKIDNIDEQTRQVDTFDFTISDYSTPYIIANGIVIHNSIGKKIPELMTQVEIMFMEKSKNLGRVDNKTATQIFSWIREAQKYSFNKTVSENTIVETPNGSKKIKDVEPGDFVLCPVNNNNEFCEVLNKYDHGVQELYEIELESGDKISCTMDHKFLAENGQVLPLREILLRNLGIMTKDGV